MNFSNGTVIKNSTQSITLALKQIQILYKNTNNLQIYKIKMNRNIEVAINKKKR